MEYILYIYIYKQKSYKMRRDSCVNIIVRGIPSIILCQTFVLTIL